MRRYLSILVLFSGCSADMRMKASIQAGQARFIQESTCAQVAARPPETMEEAERLTAIVRVAQQSERLSRIEIRHKGSPNREVPAPTDYEAIHHETMVYEEAVDAELAWKDAIKPFLPSGNGKLMGIANGGGVGVLVTALVGLWTRSRKQKKVTGESIKKKDMALAQMFEVAAKVIPKDRLKKELDGTEAQAEYRACRDKNGGA